LSDLLTVSDAAQRLKVSESFLNKLRSQGGSPKYLRIGRAVRYRAEDLDAWAETRSASQTSEYTTSSTQK
jgi:excisionase family DNA binding protein